MIVAEWVAMERVIIVNLIIELFMQIQSFSIENGYLNGKGEDEE